MTTRQKYTVAGRLRRAIIDLSQAGNYVERADTVRAVRNIEAGVDHLTEALGAIREIEGIPPPNPNTQNLKGGRRGRGRPRPSGKKEKHAESWWRTK